MSVVARIHEWTAKRQVHIQLVALAVVSLYLLVLSTSLTACDVRLLTGSIITNAVLAKDIRIEDAAPVNVTSEFAPEQKLLHLIVSAASAPKNTTVKAVWTAVDVGGSTPANSRLDESELVIAGSGNFEFTLPAKGGRFPSGKYKVDLFVNKQLNRSINFTIAGPIAARVPTPTVGQLACPQPTTFAYKPSGLITKVTMAEKVDAFKLPVTPTTVFKPLTTAIHAVTNIRGAPAGTRVKVVWFASDVGKAAPCNRMLREAEGLVPTAGTTFNLDFLIESTGDPWPVGSYRAEVYVNGRLDQVVTFAVKE